MNFQFYLEKLYDSKEFLKFRKENPKAFLCSGFFSIDKKIPQKNKESKADNQQHLDYYIPELKKMFSFKLDQNPIEMTPIDHFGYIDEKDIKKISDNIDFNFEELEKIIEEKMEHEKINKKIEKILWSLQNKEGKEFLIGTVFISNLGMIKISYDLQEKKLVDFQKKSFLDFIRIVKKKDKE
jgi:hypothetical protein